MSKPGSPGEPPSTISLPKPLFYRSLPDTGWSPRRMSAGTTFWLAFALAFLLLLSLLIIAYQLLAFTLLCQRQRRLAHHHRSPHSRRSGGWDQVAPGDDDAESVRHPPSLVAAGRAAGAPYDPPVARGADPKRTSDISPARTLSAQAAGRDSVGSSEGRRNGAAGEKGLLEPKKRQAGSTRSGGATVASDSVYSQESGTKGIEYPMERLAQGERVSCSRACELRRDRR